MRLDNVGPRTLLLAATAGWAVLALVLALFNMGGRISKRPADPALLKALPSLPKVVPERLGPLSQYAETANRPLFAEDRRPRPFLLRAEGGEEQAKTFDYVLTSVIITPNFKMAIIRPSAPDGANSPLRVRLGEPHESLPGWMLQALDERGATFVGPEGERRLDLGVFNGVGGEAPTASVRPPQPPPSPVGEGAPPPQEVAPDAAVPAPPVEPPVTPPASTPSPPMTEQAQMEAIRKRIEARRAQLRQEALLEQQRQKQKSPAK